jgi:hypothetical protein
VTFQNQEEFVTFLREQTENAYAFSFKPGSGYPLTVELKRTKDRLIITEV